ncbi:YchF/TatD family DNA exonuclease [Candidatus Blochmannia ocreatus (nom. nud.)]|uniref:YchF/TatD family DNA exonuclease n=1 Tax=Candidatus Blochmannia ocreatus (nom. nud.) TaxID=251538 RepID=A0ABY4SYJ1_9ENTR|nr:YchF/TatD family DNA exonuclease [Candidatus Blochmannia ocreatus]URJ24904.1 YchF/TatD family DNA exonuclease [Candidatus Blochmannia ocreatus]
MFLVDSHCHLNKLNYTSIHANVSDALNKANKKGVNLFLSVSTVMSDYDNMVKLVGCRKDVVFSCGVHPTCVFNEINFSSDMLYILSSKTNVVAIGETGLDYYHSSNVQDKIKQKKVFQEHIHVAKSIKKPIIVHSRNSIQDTIVILRKEKAIECSGVLHCFSEDLENARLLLNLNFYISFSGMVTFNKFYMLREVIKYVPIDRILLETDSPYLTPVPYRGLENQPAYVYEIAKYVAHIKNVDLDELAMVTTKNFFALFQLES